MRLAASIFALAFTVQLTQSAEPELTLGIPMSSFIDNRLSDATIAADVFLKQVFDGSDINYSGKIYDRDEDLGEDIRAGSSDVFIVNSGLYLDCEKLFKLRPLLVATHTKKPVERLVLVAAKDRPLSNLKNGTLLIDNSARGETPERWISDHLLRSGTGEIARDFFSTVTEVNTASRALIPVYFGKSDAAVLSEAGYEKMREHNPDIDKRVQVVSRSKDLARTIVCMRFDYSDYRASKIVKILQRIHESDSGRRFLERIGAMQFLLFQEEYLLHNREMQNRLESVLSDEGGGG